MGNCQMLLLLFKKVKLSLFANNVITYVESPKNLSEKPYLIKLITNYQIKQGCGIQSQYIKKQWHFKNFYFIYWSLVDL